MFYKVPFFTFFFFLKKKAFILEEKCIDWKVNFTLNGFLLTKRRDQEKSRQKKGWQNELQTNQQNMQRFLCVV